MLNQLALSFLSYLDERILSPGDPADVRSGKRLFIWINLLIVPLGVSGMVLGLIGKSPVMVTITTLSAVLFPLNLFFLVRSRKFSLHFSIWVFGVMLLILAWGVLLGGFRTNFSTYWAAFIPLMLVIMVADQRRTIIGWFAVFCVFILAFSLLDPYVERFENAPANAVFANTYTVLMSAGLTLLTVSYYKRQKNTALHLADMERERADALLLNILPKKIADRLKLEKATIADQYEAASILFADLVGFTPLSVQMTPIGMIELLNQIYSHFDALAEKYGVEKIRTIGDNYMVAAGVPEPRQDHAQALASMALEMIEFSKRLPSQAGKSIEFRIGINSGPLVAGVIGKKKFHYDVWGDTVNTASRMESQGVPGMIQVTRSTYEAIRDEFVCQERGLLEIKGKGQMDTWFVTGRQQVQR